MEEPFRSVVSDQKLDESVNVLWEMNGKHYLVTYSGESDPE
jgi:hypothetical protein